MKFRVPERPGQVEGPPEVLVGNVYPSQGGRKFGGKDTFAWVVMGIRGRAVHCVGVNSEGEIVSTTSYGLHVFQSRPVIGFCDDIANYSPAITWYDPPAP